MATPSPEAVAAIRAHVPAQDWAARSDAQVAADLNAPAVDNPDPRGAVPVPYAFADVMGLLSAASVAAVRDTPTATALIAAINARDTASVVNWLGALLATPARITADEAAAVQARVTATQPDPDWPAQVGWARAHLGRDVDAAYVAACRPAP